jgi:hypothetical protein
LTLASPWLSDHEQMNLSSDFGALCLLTYATYQAEQHAQLYVLTLIYIVANTLHQEFLSFYFVMCFPKALKYLHLLVADEITS